MARRFHFDRAYYHRYYRDPDTRVLGPEEMRRLADFVCTYLRHLGQPVRRVLDLGCGLGWWRRILRRHFPAARYTGVETSDYLCRRYGWRRGSVTDFRARAPYDLVICQGVLQYLPPAEAEAAIANLAGLCRGALYLEVLTREDWLHRCDRSRTDGAVHLRRAAWYRRRLQRHFANAGGGVFLSPRSAALAWELDLLPPAPAPRPARSSPAGGGR